MTRTLPGGPPPAVLTFSGHDPSGGAGVQADIEALAAVGCRALTVVTALTVQDTRDVQRVEPVDPGLVEAQARTVLADLPVAAFKIGLLGSAGVAETVAAVLRDHPQHPVVLDPITAAGGGTLDVQCVDSRWTISVEEGSTEEGFLVAIGYREGNANWQQWTSDLFAWLQESRDMASADIPTRQGHGASRSAAGAPLPGPAA